MLMSRPAAQGGFSMLELMVTVAIIGILASVAMPQFSDWIRRNSVRSAAEVLQSALRQAEGEAIRRNLRIEFLLTNGTPAKSGIKLLTPVANGQNWAIRALGSDYLPLSDEALAYVNGFSMKEVSADVTVQGPARLVFSGTGRVTDITGVAISQYQVYRVARSGADRVMCVFVTPGGAVKACDPSLASGQPFACLPQVSLTQCPKA